MQIIETKHGQLIKTQIITDGLFRNGDVVAVHHDGQLFLDMNAIISIVTKSKDNINKCFIPIPGVPDHTALIVKQTCEAFESAFEIVKSDLSSYLIDNPKE